MKTLQIPTAQEVRESKRSYSVLDRDEEKVLEVLNAIQSAKYRDYCFAQLTYGWDKESREKWKEYLEELGYKVNITNTFKEVYVMTIYW